jgi:diguanylate cyclase (GGDEF)-like protein
MFFMLNLDKPKLANFHINENRIVADRDALTKLLTRGAFESEFPLRIDDAMKSSSPLSVVMVDIDYFKAVNDRYGHQKGDEVLIGVAASISSVVEGKGMVYRYGGEELVIVLFNHSIQEAIAVAERARRELESAEINGLKVTASFGVSTFPYHGKNNTELINGADSALYDAKNKGRNLVRVFNEPAPVQKVREPKKRLPEHGTLSEKEMTDLRSNYFRSLRIFCPKDEAILDVTEITEPGVATPKLLIWCKLCGLREEI